MKWLLGFVQLQINGNNETFFKKIRSPNGIMFCNIIFMALFSSEIPLSASHINVLLLPCAHNLGASNVRVN